ncbi:unnamed protein product [Gadus morhua 'NCC']
METRDQATTPQCLALATSYNVSPDNPPRSGGPGPLAHRGAPAAPSHLGHARPGSHPSSLPTAPSRGQPTPPAVDRSGPSGARVQAGPGPRC